MIQRCMLACVLTLAVSRPIASQTLGEAVFVASTRGSVYYWVGCSNWQRLAPGNLVFFSTRAQAVDAGYRPSSDPACAGPPDVLPSTTDPLIVRVVDVGAGLCTITGIPSADRVHYVVYDAGHWRGRDCLSAAREIVGASTIDLLVISHSDSDHLGDADLILDEFVVASVVSTGFERSTASWRSFQQSLEAARVGGTSVRRLTDDPLTPGETVEVGDAIVTFVAGWGRWDLTTGLTTGERRNAISIVIRIDYAGASILYAGDTVGRRLGDPDSACKDAEMVMVGRHVANEVSLAANVMITAHHGGNNGNSRCFIETIAPSAVVFSSGHDHAHPTAAVAHRFLAAGVAADSLFRTDRGDDESASGHWEPESTVAGCADSAGDDDVVITIAPTGEVAVRYLDPTGGCQ